MVATAKRKLDMETSLATLKRETPEQLLKRIVSLDKNIRYHEKKLKRSKNELYVSVYLLITANPGTSLYAGSSPAFKALVEATGREPNTIRDWYHNGRLACTLDVDIARARPASLGALPLKIEPRHYKPIAQALNRGDRGVKVGKLLEDLGYTPRKPKFIPSFVAATRARTVQRNHRKWSDWKSELEALAERMALTTDGPVHLELHAYVGKDAWKPAVVAKVDRD